MLGLGLGLNRTTNNTISSGGGLVQDYQDIITAATASGYSVPSASIQQAGSDFITNSGNAWTKGKHIYVLQTDGDEDFALLDWKNPSTPLFALIRQGSTEPVFQVNEGYIGVSSGQSRLAFQYSPADVSGELPFGETTMAAVGYNLFDSGAGRNVYIFLGTNSNSANQFNIRSGTADDLYVGGWGDVITQGSLPSLSDNDMLDFTGDLSGTGNHIIRINGSVVDSSNPFILNTTGATTNLASFRYAATYTDNGCRLIYLGEKLTTAESLQLYNAFTTYRNSF